MIKKIAFSAVPLAAAAALTMSGVAHAAGPVATVDSQGTIGYQAVQNAGGATYFTHIIGQFGLGNPQYSTGNPTLQVNRLSHYLNDLPVNAGNGGWVPFTNNEGFTTAAVRVGLCGGFHRAHAGTTVQEMIVPVSTGRYDVVAFAGQYAAGTPNDDACLDSTLPTGELNVLLRNVPARDTTQLDVIYDGEHSHNGVQAGVATLVANDLSHPSSATANTPGQVFGSARSEFYEADAGLIGADGTPNSTLTGDVLPDTRGPNLAVKLAHVQLNGNDDNSGNEVHGTLQSDAAWEALPVVDHTHGEIAGAVSAFSYDHFSVYTAPGVLNYSSPGGPGSDGNGSNGNGSDDDDVSPTATP